MKTKHTSSISSSEGGTQRGRPRALLMRRAFCTRWYKTGRVPSVGRPWASNSSFSSITSILLAAFGFFTWKFESPRVSLTSLKKQELFSYFNLIQTKIYHDHHLSNIFISTLPEEASREGGAITCPLPALHRHQLHHDLMQMHLPCAISE